jgi:2-polyprenyl-6-methoxyphenol hydroxylase-like FAD-dependent oxidoreductase
LVGHVAGMNTGIQDAHNLAWKVASVIKGIAPTSMLNTYDLERRPVMLLSSVALFECLVIFK